MGALGRNWRARMAARFGGRLSSATLTKKTVSGPNLADVTGPPTSTTASYTCDALALSFEARFVDGEDIKKGDYQVVVLRGTIADSNGDAADVVADPGDVISCPPPGSTTPIASRVVSVNPVTEAFYTCHVRGGLP